MIETAKQPELESGQWVDIREKLPEFLPEIHKSWVANNDHDLATKYQKTERLMFLTKDGEIKVGSVIYYLKRPGIRHWHYDGDHKEGAMSETEVTYWMYLPEKPQQVNPYKYDYSVILAEPYRDGAPKMTNMLIRQFQFPADYNYKDRLVSVDHDRLLDVDFAHVQQCFKKHTGSGELNFCAWARTASDEQVLAFLQDAMRAALKGIDEGIKGTGYRILGTTNRGQGGPIWTFELFAVHPTSQPMLCTGDNQPNVRGYYTS